MLYKVKKMNKVENNHKKNLFNFKSWESQLVKFFYPGRVGSAIWFGFGFWKISPKNVKFFNFFPLESKKISSGRVKRYPVHGRPPLI